MVTYFGTFTTCLAIIDELNVDLQFGYCASQCVSLHRQQFINFGVFLEVLKNLFSFTEIVLSLHLSPTSIETSELLNTTNLIKRFRIGQHRECSFLKQILGIRKTCAANGCLRKAIFSQSTMGKSRYGNKCYQLYFSL